MRVWGRGACGRKMQTSCLVPSGTGQLLFCARRSGLWHPVCLESSGRRALAVVWLAR